MFMNHLNSPTKLHELTRSVITYIVCMMVFMWRSSTSLPDDYVFRVSPSTENSLRAFVSAVLAVGAIYTVLIARTLRRYGSRMDIAWRKRLDEYRKRQPQVHAPPYTIIVTEGPIRPSPTQPIPPHINTTEPLYQSPIQYVPDKQLPISRSARQGGSINARLGSGTVREREIIEEHPDEAESEPRVAVLPPAGSPV